EDFYYDYGAEEITDYQDPSELVAALKQKEEEVILAAQLGNALLLENQQLKEQSEQLHERYADKLEQELEQKRHELQVKLEGCRSQWESQVGDLERDARELSARVEHLTLALNEAERNKTRAEMEHGEDIQRLKDQLNAAMEVERVMSSELQALKQELQQKTSQNRQQDEELISAMKEQVLRLTQKEQTLEERLENVCHENAELRTTLASLNARLSLQEQLNQQQSQQKNMMEAELVRSKNDMMCLNNQLLEAIQRKLELSQELEAWQDDIQIILNQQLKSQQQSEQVQNKTTSNGLSFFRRPNRISNSTWSPDSNGHKAQSPWRDW
uniref:Uncharacterized protein n=1 Tax=Periophthalmus magnuspinnatus TaxID=409849 RepID=A0A3B4BCS7_9GOBI